MMRRLAKLVLYDIIAIFMLVNFLQSSKYKSIYHPFFNYGGH